ncbi:MAG: orotidine-5'-phosphate decarboxylase [Candidatus Lokiarchaeota archaeon]|nr:orotidine-5'-phosphate decarboxylase [Candidatus Lokiarchaeota archaeon]
MYFAERLIELVKDKSSVVCVGLDPRLEKEGEIPRYLVRQFDNPNEIIIEFNKTIIDNTCDLIPIIKPQIAFYEKYNALRALKETIKYAHKNDLLVILDSKRNDIGSTSKAYADSTFKEYGADACTLNGYLGIDSIQPYLDEYPEKGLFILVKTSNPSSQDFQDLFSIKLEDVNKTTTDIVVNDVKLERNYIQLAKLVDLWSKKLPTFSTFNNLGVVVGATFPEELNAIRKVVKNSFILMPGYGTQGATIDNILPSFNKQGLGGIVNSSRNVNYAYNNYKQFTPSQFGKAARFEVTKMNRDINKVIKLN